MNDLRLVKNNSDLAIKLHPMIINILFNHKRDISNRLRDIIGIYSIDHVAIIILNPTNEITIFSQTPSVEYNLIINDLWRYDNSFGSKYLTNDSLYWWDESYHPSYKNTLINTKENLHKFALGMNLIRKINGYTFTYSFATRNTGNELQEYYRTLKNELLQIGDYAYNLIRNIFEEYSNPCQAPILVNDTIPSIRNKHLSLIINN